MPLVQLGKLTEVLVTGLQWEFSFSGWVYSTNQVTNPESDRLHPEEEII